MTQETPLRHQYTELHQIFIDKSISEADYKQQLAEIIKPESLNRIKKLDLTEDFIEKNDLHAFEVLKEAVEKKFLNQDERIKEFKLLLPLKMIIQAINGSLTKQILNFIIDECSFDINAKNECRNTILHDVIDKDNVEIATFLINHKDIKINKPNIYGNTPLHDAVSKGNLIIFECLIKHKDIKINKPNIYGNTPLHNAVFKNNLKIVELLTSHDDIDINARNKKRLTAWCCAINERNLEIEKYLTEKMEAKKNTHLTGQHPSPIIKQDKKKQHEGLTASIDPVLAVENNLKEQDEKITTTTTNQNSSTTGGQNGDKKQVDNKLGTVRRFLTNVVSPVVMTLATPYVKLYSLIASPIMAIADYLFNGKKAKSVMLNSMLEIATYVVAGMLVGMFGLNTVVGYAVIAATSAALNIGVNLADEHMSNIIESHLPRKPWVKSLEQKEADHGQVIIQ